MKVGILIAFSLVAGVLSAHKPGGRIKLNVHDPVLVASLASLERRMDNMINSPYVHRIGHVRQAYSQVVSGIKFYATFELNETTCLKTTTKDVEQCNTITKVDICQAELWVQPWLHKYELLNFHCGVAN